jgi:hypothetical protein
MPIRPEERERYPADWPAISLAVRSAAGWRCQGTTMYPGCRAAAGEAHPETGSLVILTVAHMDHDPSNNAETNLRALCQRCHLAWDRSRHAENARLKRSARYREAASLALPWWEQECPPTPPLYDVEIDPALGRQPFGQHGARSTEHEADKDPDPSPASCPSAASRASRSVPERSEPGAESGPITRANEEKSECFKISTEAPAPARGRKPRRAG